LGVSEDDELLGRKDAAEHDFQSDEDHEAREYTTSSAKKRRKTKSAAGEDEPHAFKPKQSSRTATINPNTISHQHFESLKIRAKTAKPTGAGGRGRSGQKRLLDCYR
jgi:hypothetical protein